MLTIPAALAPYLNSSGSPVWILRIYKSEGATDPDSGSDPWPSTTGTSGGPSERVFPSTTPDFSDLDDRVADHAFHLGRVTEDSFSDIVMSLGSADRRPGGLAGVDSTTVAIDNTDGAIYGYAQADGFKGVNFEGRRAEILLTDKESTESWDPDSMLRVFYGYVNDIKVEGDSIILELDSVLVKYDNELPPNSFAEFVSGTLRERNQPVPLVFGEHDMAPGYLAADIKDTGSADAGPSYRFADCSGTLSIKAINNMRLGDKGLIEACGGFANFKTLAVPNLSDTTTFSADLTSGEGYIANPAPEYFNLFIEIKFNDWLKYQTDHDDVSSPESAFDWDLDNYAVVRANAVGETEAFGIKIPEITFDGEIPQNSGNTGIFVSGYLIFAGEYIADNDGYGLLMLGDKADITGSTSRPYEQFLVGTHDGTYDNREYGDEVSQMQLEFGSTWTGSFTNLTTLSQKYLKVVSYVEAAGGGGWVTWRIYNIGLRIFFRIQPPIEAGIYADMEGYTDTAGGTLTGTADLLLANPIHIIDALFYYWSLAGTNVDLTANNLLAATNGAREGWAFARSIYESEELTTIVDGLAEEAMVWVWADNSTGKVKVTAWDDAGAADLVMTPVDMENGELTKFTRSRIEDIVTDFEFKYKWNPVRDEFEKSFFCNSTDSSYPINYGQTTDHESLCAWASYNNGNIERKKTFEFKWIRDDDTMLAVARKLISYHTSRRWTIEANLDLSRCGLQTGDQIRLSQVDTWPVSYPADLIDASYRISKHRIKPKKSLVSIVAAEVI